MTPSAAASSIFFGCRRGGRAKFHESSGRMCGHTEFTMDQPTAVNHYSVKPTPVARRLRRSADWLVEILSFAINLTATVIGLILGRGEGR